MNQVKDIIRSRKKEKPHLELILIKLYGIFIINVPLMSCKKSRKHMTLYNWARNDDTRMKKSSQTDLRVQEIMLIADSS